MNELEVSNDEVADALERIGHLLEAQGASPFRSRAYDRAAESVRQCEERLSDILERDGLRGLDAIPGVGRSIAAGIREHLTTGRLGLLERLEGEASPEDLFRAVPGVGPELARRIHEDLAVDTLEDLELAAHDGRLDRLRGFGARRVRAVRDGLASVLGRAATRRARRFRSGKGPPEPAERVPISTLLAVDEEYRTKAEAGRLRRIAPHRFNPEKKSWLPILHVERDGWMLTAMFSNTARAHRLGKVHEWVVIYAEKNGREDRGTVVEEWSGPLRGRRVVRGRESECLTHYGAPGQPLSPRSTGARATPA